MSSTKIAFIGAGAMAESLISGLCAANLKSNTLTVTNLSDREKLERLEEQYSILTTTSYAEAVSGQDIILLAVKPKHILDSIHSIKPFLKQDQLVISVAAGITIATLEAWLPQQTAVIRAMPNTSATVHASATALSLGSYATGNHLRLAESLFASIGSVTLVTDAQMSAVTAVAGSGPAYIYYVAEAMIDSAVHEGLSPGDARSLVAQTIAGAAKQLKQSSRPPKQLYQEIMSPKGTTEAAMTRLQHSQVDFLFKDAIQHAIKRSNELGQSYSPSNTETRS